MAQYRIVKTNKGRYFVQERVMLFFWSTKGEEGGEFSGDCLYEFDSAEEARQYIRKLKEWVWENEFYKIVEYH